MAVIRTTSLALALLSGLLLLGGCGTFGTPRPLKGGTAVVSTASAKTPAAVTLTPPENPSTPSSQNVVEKKEEVYVFPQETKRITETKTPDGTSIVVTEVIPAGTKKTVSDAKEVTQNIGAAQKDTSREISAKLASFKPVQFVGIALLLGAAAMFHPVVRAAVGAGKEMQVSTAAIGLALVFGPSLFVGNERLILLGGLAALLAVFGLSRLSYYKGKVDSAK